MRLFYATREVLLFIKINMTRITHILIAAVTITMLTECSVNDSRQEVDIPLDNICVGDIAFRRGEGITSTIVLYKDAEGQYSHVGVVAKSDSGLVVVHAVPGDDPNQEGVDIVRAEFLNHFFASDKATKGEIMRLALDSTQQNAINRYALEKARQKIEFDHQYDLDDTTRLYCTELLHNAFDRAGINITEGRISNLSVPGKQYDLIMPSDIHKNANLKTVFIF